ncbi:hypothetical protein [Sphingomonas sp.]|uniref:hypothetical protein n=1 Tax=Sphingomonas sp. TaxID=28214 RepID=UPI003B003155
MSNGLPPRKRLMPIDRWAGVATQFERTDGGYLFRRHGHGPAIRVAMAERDAFVAAGMRALLGHAAAFVGCGGAAWLVVREMMADSSPDLTAVAVGIVLSLVALALYVSQRWYADAPARALAHRPVVAPARDPDFSGRVGYLTIAVGTSCLVVIAALGTDQPRSFYVAFATIAVMGGIFAAIGKWFGDAALSPAQYRRALAAEDTDQRHHRERAAALERAHPTKAWHAPLLLAVLALEIVVLIGALCATVAVAGAITGTGYAEMAFGPFMVAFVAGLVLGGLLVWPLDGWCKRRTGSSAIDALNVIPDW